MNLNWTTVFTRKRKILLGLVGGAITWLGVTHYWESKEQQLEHRGKTTQVWVTRKYIPAGKKITVDHLEIRNVPQLYVEPGSFGPVGDVDFSRSSMTWTSRVALLKGEQLTASKVIDSRTRLGLAWSLSPGLTALSMKLSLEEAVAGFVRPGDWVAVLSPSEKFNVVVSQAQVLTVQDQTWEASSDEMLKNNFSAEAAVYVTLAVKLADAAKMVRALEQGRLHVVLLPAMEADEPAS